MKTKRKQLLTPQQAFFLANYTNPQSDTFGNATQSALKAGYTKEYAENITGLMPDWLLENIGDIRLLAKAEKVLEETIEMNDKDDRGKRDASLTKIKQDSSKFVAERLGKRKYSLRNELTGAEGKPITISFDSSFNELTRETENNSS